jgi:serine/threonine protein kinase
MRDMPYRRDDEPLGHGGYGTVYRAFHKRTGQMVALKLARDGRIPARRLSHEIDVQRNFDHPHIMPMLDLDPKKRWFTMPIAKRNLAQAMKDGSLTPHSLTNILGDVAKGLQHAHYRQHVHRDVTPANILELEVGGRRRWVVADWGLVQKPRGEQFSLPMTVSGQVLGTRQFAPPELSDNPRGVGPETDVYYLGAVAAWALSGKEPQPGRVLLPAHKGWADFIRLATVAEPARRVQSMVEVISMLYKLEIKLRPEPPALSAMTADLDACAICGGRIGNEGRCTICSMLVNPAFN